MDECAILNRIYSLLYKLGTSATYTGFFHAARAVLIAYQHPETLSAVTKWLYPEVADQYGTNWKAVERNIRYVIAELWREHPNRLFKMAGRQLTKRPTPAEFIDFLVCELRK